MPISIIANQPANYALTSLQARNEAITKSTQRLSSGSRVFNAGEDAAAQAVGTSLKIDNAGLRSASINAGAAVSMLQIAEGSLGQISDLLIRMQSLATQSSSGQFDDNTRALMNIEFDNLLDEVDRIANNTEFNDVKMIAGTTAYNFNRAAPANALGIGAPRFDTNIVNSDRAFRYSYDNTTESLTLSRVDAGVTTTQTVDLTAIIDGVAGIGQNLTTTQLAEINFSQLGVTLTLNSSFNRSTAIASSYSASLGSVTFAANTGVTPTVNQGVPVAAGLAALASNYNTTTGVLNLPFTTNGVTATLTGVPGLSYQVNGGAIGASGAASANLVGAGPTTINVYVDYVAPDVGQGLVGTISGGAFSTAGVVGGSFNLGVGTGLFSATDSGNIDDTRLTYKIGLGVTAGQDLLGVNVPAMTLEALALDERTGPIVFRTRVAINNEMNANDAINRLKTALTTLNQGRANVGAQQLRLEAVGRNLAVVIENNDSARSTLLDVDVPKEITDLTANQAMLQAGVAMLSRANQTPAILLELLRNS